MRKNKILAFLKQNKLLLATDLTKPASHSEAFVNKSKNPKIAVPVLGFFGLLDKYSYVVKISYPILITHFS